MRCAVVLLLLALALVAGGCAIRAERNALRDDLGRFRAERTYEYEKIKRDLSLYARNQQLLSKELPLDLARFLEWRRREWWNLNDETAALIAYEWDAVEKLSHDVGRFYGYNIRMFPHLTEDIARFFQHTDDEWVALVKDACLFIEFKDRELLPLRTDIRESWERAEWEAGNLQVDVHQFLQWREREGNKLVKDVREFRLEESVRGNELRGDFRRFRAARALEANYLVADFSAYWQYETRAMPPRLIADVARWAQLPPQQMNQLRQDIYRYWQGINADAIKLVDDLGRYFPAQLDLIPKLAAEVDDFFDVYEREWGPLEAGARRFWRHHVGLGIVARDDMRRFFTEHAGEEAAELQADVRRFFSYSRKEWKDFRTALNRFFNDDSGRPFGVTRMQAIPTGAGVFEDPRSYPARGYDAGIE